MVEKDGSAKGIVFSQFTSFLDISRHICVVSGADVQLHNKGGQECEWRWVSRFNSPPKTESSCVKREGKEGLAFGRRRLSCCCYCYPSPSFYHFSFWNSAAFMLIRIAHGFSFLYEVYEKRIVAEAGCFTVSLSNGAQGLGETFGRVTIEAMAFGLPVLGTEAGGTKEIVEHNVTGLLHPVGHDGTRGLAENHRFLLKMCAIKAFHLTIDVEEL
ncbi:hypothetical protein FF1_009592 [Malus domestica]